MTALCECRTIEDAAKCARKCLPMPVERWWELCRNECPPDRPCNEDDSLAVRKHCDDRSIEPSMLGDWLATALSKVGLSKERVERWLGRPCGCERRKQKLNALHRWLKRRVA